MLKTKNNKLVKYRNSNATVDMEIQCFDDDNFNEFTLLLNFIKLLSEGKNIYINSYGLDKSSVDENDIISSATDLNEPLHRLLSLKNIEPNNINKNIFESRYTIFYLFDKSVKWDDFLTTKNIKEKKYFNNGILFAVISVGDCESVLLEISREYENTINSFLEEIQRYGYLIKKHIV